MDAPFSGGEGGERESQRSGVGRGAGDSMRQHDLMLQEILSARLGATPPTCASLAQDDDDDTRKFQEARVENLPIPMNKLQLHLDCL